MSTENNGIVINRLPSPTWFRLGVNSALAEKREAFDGISDYLTRKNPDQVDLKKLPAGEAEKYADSFSDGIRREKYIAGKRAIYQEQQFASGLGAEFDSFMKEAIDEVDVYTVEEGKKLSSPVILSYDFKEGASTASAQIIRVCKGAQAVFIINQKSVRSAAGYSANSTKVIVEQGAKLHLIKNNLTGRGYTVLDDTAAVVRDSGEFDFTQLLLGGDKVYAGCYADLCGDKSSLVINTGYTGDYENLTDINYVACHRGKKTDSEITVNGSLKDKATKVFRGTIDFRNGSADSQGDEREDVLLLSPHAVNKTVPVILTEEEQVAGHHGATIGNLSEDMLFYLQTRGISKSEAEELMTRGRLQSIADKIPDEGTLDEVSSFICRSHSKPEKGNCDE
ncbi:MAG: SufD family Fe-S cluster assembly protein [Clostridia bacterium]|nr:SufD family Fe-S cluster assembly protein [Clostridia bacterium]